MPRRAEEWGKIKSDMGGRGRSASEINAAVRRGYMQYRMRRWRSRLMPLLWMATGAVVGLMSLPILPASALEYIDKGQRVVQDFTSKTQMERPNIIPTEFKGIGRVAPGQAEPSSGFADAPAIASSSAGSIEQVGLTPQEAIDVASEFIKKADTVRVRGLGPLTTPELHDKLRRNDPLFTLAERLLPADLTVQGNCTDRCVVDGRAYGQRGGGMTRNYKVRVWLVPEDGRWLVTRAEKFPVQ